MNISLTEVSSDDKGELYKLSTSSDENKPLYINLLNISPMFSPDKIYGVYYIKWNIRGVSVDLIEKIEYNLQNIFEGYSLVSNIQNRPKYPLLLNTKYKYKKSGESIITDSIDNISDYIVVNSKEDKYNITLSVNNIYLDKKTKTIKYPLDIRKISKSRVINT